MSATTKVFYMFKANCPSSNDPEISLPMLLILSFSETKSS